MTDSELFAYIKNKSDYKVTGIDFDYSIELDDSTKSINIFFKESDSEVDWRINLDFLPSFLKIRNHIYFAHRGYIYAFLSAQNEIIKDITAIWEEHKDFKFNIYGWSYGSAVAGLCLVTLADRYKVKVNEMVTFGSVKMWYFPGKKTLLKFVTSVREYTTPNDFVTWQAPFCHRINKVKVGDSFSIFKIFKTPYYHCNYDKFIK